MSKKKYAIERKHAPNVDPEWTSDFLLEARLQDVPGKQIGDALAEIDSHVAESGDSAEQAFGEPKAYAQALAAVSPKLDKRGIFALIIPAMLQTLGMLGVLNALEPAMDGAPFVLTVGLLVMIGVLLALLVLLAVQPTSMLRLIIDRPWLAFGLNFVLLAGLVGLLLIPGEVAEIPAWWVVGIGVAALVAGTVVGIAQSRDYRDDDPIESPTDDEASKPSRTMSLLPQLMIPIVTIALAPVFLFL